MSTIHDSSSNPGKKPIEIADKKKNKKNTGQKTGHVKTDVQPISKSQVTAQLNQIDELFSDAKKRKSAVETMDDTASKKKQKTEAKKKHKREQKKSSSEEDVDSDDPDVDPYYEFIDDDDDDEQAPDDNATYGLINNAYNPNKIINPEAPLERIQDGVPVYKAHLLKVGEGGGTPLCPFDCNCCF